MILSSIGGQGALEPRRLDQFERRFQLMFFFFELNAASTPVAASTAGSEVENKNDQPFRLCRVLYGTTRWTNGATVP